MGDFNIQIVEISKKIKKIAFFKNSFVNIPYYRIFNNRVAKIYEEFKKKINKGGNNGRIFIRERIII